VQAVEALRGSSTAPRSAYAGTLEAAGTLARQWAGELPDVGAIVLSPASASWDQFANYEKRGDTFVALAQRITS